jgi:hypothetical protein
MIARACSLLVLATALTTSARATPQVPSGLVAAAGATPGVFADYLVESAIPAGIELHEADMPRTFPPAMTIDRNTTMPIAQLVAAFNDRQKAYRAALVDGVFVIRPAAGKAAYLDAAAPGPRVRVRGLAAATRRLFAPLDPRLASGDARAPVAAGGKDDAGDAVQVDVDTNGRSILNVLNTLAKQVPNRAWLALTSDGEPARVSQIGFIRPNGYSLLSVSVSGRPGGGR